MNLYDKVLAHRPRPLEVAIFEHKRGQEHPIRNPMPFYVAAEYSITVHSSLLIITYHLIDTNHRVAWPLQQANLCSYCSILSIFLFSEPLCGHHTNNHTVRSYTNIIFTFKNKILYLGALKQIYQKIFALCFMN